MQIASGGNAFFRYKLVSKRLRHAEFVLLFSALLISANVPQAAWALGPDPIDGGTSGADVVDNHFVDYNHFAGQTLEQSGLRQSFYAVDVPPRRPKLLRFHKASAPGVAAVAPVVAPSVAGSSASDASFSEASPIPANAPVSADAPVTANAPVTGNAPVGVNAPVPAERTSVSAKAAREVLAIPSQSIDPIQVIDELAKTPVTPSAGQIEPNPSASNVGGAEQASSRLSTLEQQLFDHQFEHEEPGNRLGRLEKSVFGEVRAGDATARESALFKALEDSANKLTVSNRFRTPLTIEHGPRTFQQAMEEGTKNYDASRFHAAEESFEIAACFKPTEPRVHYCLGRTLAKLGDLDGAHREFKICFRLDPFGQFGSASKSAMLESASAAASAAAAPADKPMMVQRAIATIRYQAHDAATSRIAQGQATAEGRMRLGTQWVQQIAERVQEELNGYYGGGYYNGGGGYNGGGDNGGGYNGGGYNGGGYNGGGYNGGGYYRGRRGGYYRDPQAMQEVSNWRAIATSYARTDTAVQASKARRDGIQRAETLHDCANNLVRLIGDTPEPGHPKLRAYGTCLYVRYYGSENPDDVPPPVDPVQELHAIAKKITPETSKKSY